MIEMTVASTETQLSRLLATCQETGSLAGRLADRATEVGLRTFLLERAQRYQQAARELRRLGGTLGVEEDGAGLSEGAQDGKLGCIKSVWEAIECSALICFRDAIDEELPPEIYAAVRGCVVDGIRALERLRAPEI
jgi:hypothetical protein